MKTLLSVALIVFPLTTWSVCDLKISPQDYQQTDMFEDSTDVGGETCKQGRSVELMQSCQAGHQNCRILEEENEPGECSIVIEGELNFPKTAAGDKAIKCRKLDVCLEDALFGNVENIDDNEIKAIGEKQRELACENAHVGAEGNSDSRDKTKERGPILRIIPKDPGPKRAIAK